MWHILWHRAFDLNVTNVAQSFFVGFRYNPGLDLSVVRMGLCAMNPQKFGVKGVFRCAAGAWSYFRLSQSIGICPPVILPVFYSFYCTEPKGLKNNGMTQSLQNPGVLQRENSSGLFYSKTGPNTAQNLSVFCLRNLLAVMKPFYPCYNT